MEQKIDIDGLTLAFRKEGHGPVPVVVMHGWGCNAKTMAIPAAAALTDGTTVYNLDLPGFGDSAEPPAFWGVEEYTALVEKFCRRQGIVSPVLIGHSFGGRLAILMASRTPVSKVILLDAAGIKPRRSLKYYIKVYSFKLGRRLLPLIAGRRRGDEIVERWRRKAGSSDYSMASPAMRQVMNRAINLDLTDRLHLIQAPTLLIWGGRDTATPLRDAKIMEKSIPDAGLVVYPEAGHFAFLERGPEVTAVIRNFIGG